MNLALRVNSERPGSNQVDILHPQKQKAMKAKGKQGLGQEKYKLTYPRKSMPKEIQIFVLTKDKT